MSLENVTYSKREVAKLLGVTVQTLSNWEKSGMLVPSLRINQKSVYYTQEDLRLFTVTREN
jgi:DNA-binding transcriptional MerR regulator